MIAANGFELISKKSVSYLLSTQCMISIYKKYVLFNHAASLILDQTQNHPPLYISVKTQKDEWTQILFSEHVPKGECFCTSDYEILGENDDFVIKLYDEKLCSVFSDWTESFPLRIRLAAGTEDLKLRKKELLSAKEMKETPPFEEEEEQLSFFSIG